jgi:acylphosphatase
MPRAHLLVKGDVQGVGFRFFCSRTANNLGLKGFVRNLPDGSVEITAEGPRETLEKLLKLVRDGPITARVDSVKVSLTHETREFSSFEIRF